MKSLSVRGIPDQVYEALNELAAKNGRSLHQQVKIILEKEATLQKIGTLNRMKNWRKKLEGRDWGSITRDIRQDRENR